MTDFTPTNESSANKSCDCCHTVFSSSVKFYYLKGPWGTSCTCCPACTQHYQRKCRPDERADEVEIDLSGTVDFTATAAPFQQRGPDRNEQQVLVRASSSAQRGVQSLPRQRLGPTFLPGPHAIPSNSAAAGVRQSVLRNTSVGYTPNHSLHSQHRSKMIAATTAPQCHVTITVALHHLKEEGKSGTELVGNIERDINVPLTITCFQLRAKVITVLERSWNTWSGNHILNLNSLEMHKAPKLLLHDPTNPDVDGDQSVLYDLFFSPTNKDPTPKFNSNRKVTILLLMSYAQFKDILRWKEAIKRGIAPDNFNNDIDEDEDSDSPMSRIFRTVTMRSKRSQRQRKSRVEDVEDARTKDEISKERVAEVKHVTHPKKLSRLEPEALV
ncbi:hypothetical protein SERLA73DRAFT_150821 [Serpula lacrymans var. lacrymans S7.3]|uniref:Uncharacterized protein n=2 Tax=Serpula lacrymans var. lacrymans TaxID=341189 RepID=F8PNG3_SERL3|nr:uncharacterized protein SERLADRAFT_435109 [Serpula lacrymans var. lacrymans S7.9]EGO01690.1 hypothetical protein SERLA73DRAFT_150821 [Serpula lacrymans var. lacrymans S7.3]EGO27332.1 hypothetical protein SERLADRAFT_435109 [Serpula lacrymans var. lacrymans S7.9]